MLTLTLSSTVRTGWSGLPASGLYKPVVFPSSPIALSKSFKGPTLKFRGLAHYEYQKSMQPANERIMRIDQGRINVNEPPPPPSPFTLPKFDVGMTRFLKRVYTFTGVGVCGSLLVSSLAIPFAISNPMGSLLVGAILSFGSLVPLTMYKPKYKQIQENGQMIKYAEDDGARYLSFAALVSGMGLTMAPLTALCFATSPAIVPAAFLMSSMVFGGCALYSTKCKDETMLKWEGPLMVGLYSLVGLGLTSIVSMLIFGPNSFSTLMMSVDTYCGLLLFVGLSIVDSHKAMKMYKEGHPDHISCSVTLYLDFMNILIRLMKIMQDVKKIND